MRFYGLIKPKNFVGFAKFEYFYKDLLYINKV